MNLPQSGTTERVAVCVATHNRAALLPRLFAALASQQLPATEFGLVIVDDGSVDETHSVLQSLAADCQFEVTVLRNDAARGPANARNRAWRAAQSPIIAFTDDDCVPSPGWLSAGRQAMTDGARIVCGRIDANPNQLAGDGPFARKLVVGAAQQGWFATANIFYTREDLEHLGGFDEAFPGAAGEDTELGLRAERIGIESTYDSETLVWHDVTPGRPIDVIRDQSRWSALPLVFRRHPDRRDGLLHRRIFWRPSHLEIIVLLAGVALLPRSRRAALLAVPWLHGKLCRDNNNEALNVLVPNLGWLLAIDLAELIAIVRGSIRHRTLML